MDEPRKRGRPPNAAPVPRVDETPAACPTCGSTDITGREGVTRTEVGETQGSKDWLVRSYGTCRKCGQRCQVNRIESGGRVLTPGQYAGTATLPYQD